MNIIQIPSPNFGERKGYKSEIFVIHIMAGTLAGTASWFATTTSQVSSHFGIGKNGIIHQYVDIQKSAWANGRVLNPNFKLYKPNINPNLYTLSIECEGYDLKDAPETQLKAISELLQQLSKEYNIPLNRDTVIGHYQIFSGKPNCPSTDKSVLDKIVKMSQNIPETPKSIIIKKVEEALALIKEL